MLNRIFVILIVGFAIYFIGRQLYMKPKFRNGESLPVIKATLMNGDSFDLENLRGQYVLVDFWGSWCGPCREDNPKLVKLYDKYKAANFKEASGFEIVSIAIETNEDQWKRAIEKDGLSWPYQIVQLDRFQSKLIKEFGVREIPTKYLLNEKGQIISVNDKVGTLDQLLSARM